VLLIWIAEYLDGFFSHCASNITIDLHNTQMTKSEWAMCFILFHMCFEYLSWSFLIYHPIPIIRLFLGIVMSETLFRNATCQLRSRKPLPDTWIAQRRSRIHEIGHDGLGRLGLRNRARLKKKKNTSIGELGEFGDVFFNFSQIWIILNHGNKPGAGAEGSSGREGAPPQGFLRREIPHHFKGA